MKLIHATLNFTKSLLTLLITYLPGHSGIMVRRLYYRKHLLRCGRNLTVMPGVSVRGCKYVSIGDNVMIRENVIISAGVRTAEGECREIRRLSSAKSTDEGFIEIGSFTSIGHGAFILGGGGVKVGKKCGIGPGAKLLSESLHHRGTDLNIDYKYSITAPDEELCVARGFTQLMDGSAITSNVIVLPGATVGKGTWLLPNSVLPLGRKTPENAILKGDPPVVLNFRSYMKTE